jgi:hypothetical protein
MARTVADHLLDRLEEWGVRTMFGYSGDGINGRLIVCVLNNGVNMVIWEMRAIEGNPRFEQSQTVPSFPTPLGCPLAVGSTELAVVHNPLTTDWRQS